MTHWKQIAVLVSLIPLLSVTGCASTQTVYKTNTIYRNPPAFLLADCPVPEYTGTQWGDVVAYAGEVQTMLSICNTDKELLREWVGTHD